MDGGNAVAAAVIVATVSGIAALLAHAGHRQEHGFRRREEFLRMLRWAVEACADTGRSKVGIATLTGLVESELFHRDDRPLVEHIAPIYLPWSVLSHNTLEGLLGEGDWEYEEG